MAAFAVEIVIMLLMKVFQTALGHLREDVIGLTNESLTGYYCISILNFFFKE